MSLSNIDILRLKPAIEKQLKDLPINDCVKYKDSKIKTHRVISKEWEKSETVDLDAEYIICHDYYRLLSLLTKGVTPAKINFWHTDAEIVDKAIKLGVKAKMTDFNNITKTYPNNFKQAHHTGNFSFDICSQMAEQLVTHPTRTFDIITMTDPALANARNTYHQKAIKDRINMLEAGLKEIIFIPLHQHRRIETKPNGEQDIKTAGLITMRIKGEWGYRGEVKVTDEITGGFYYAPRESNTFARTELGWRLSNTTDKWDFTKIKRPKVTQVAKPGYWDDSDQYYKSIIRHYTVGQAGRQSGDGGEQWALSNNRGIDKGIKLVVEKGKDFYNGGEYDCLPIYHSTKLERDSFLSLCNLDIVNKIYNDICWKRGGISLPALENFANIPLDRIWTEEDFLDYVKANY